MPFSRCKIRYVSKCTAASRGPPRSQQICSNLSSVNSVRSGSGPVFSYTIYFAYVCKQEVQSCKQLMEIVFKLFWVVLRCITVNYCQQLLVRSFMDFFRRRTHLDRVAAPVNGPDGKVKSSQVAFNMWKWQTHNLTILMKIIMFSVYIYTKTIMV